MRAHRANIEVLDAATLCPSSDAGFANRTRVVRRYVPVTARTCRRIEGTPQQQALALAQFIRTLVTAA
jgi:hypothetical protein